ncbi:aspartyl-phosphate phosphatase Spo0E family protein [Sediminibacillus halophilus]|uniref:Spo0E like sporulation regulatory protein n=1 Tax=Sediminibacillus halophilus TaxID=482461 RepID=A0A1G9NR02_9BACI|nr:aspartyl-phosphate phosphatase Spo0E family protein [Sediminibacillus halophilus]SDL89012.1 Spo0E like sporulation regulatory protein [Sediminibacillus halophilus]
MGKHKATMGEIQAKIDKKRKELYELARVKGIASSEVLRCSEELDKLIFFLQHRKYARYGKECSK